MTESTSQSNSDSGIAADDFARVQRQLLAAVRRVCPGWLDSDVDDLVQEAMIKLMRLKDSSAAEGQQQGQDQKHGEHDQGTQWSLSDIRKTAHSVVIDEIRKRQRRPEMGTEVGGEADLVSDETESPVPTDTQGTIEDCLAEQISARRRAVTLHLLGHTVTEVANYLECKAKQAENLVYRGIKQLRECLSAKGVYP